MALATKCPHCHTVFRVALDQLKLRGGIVRCGACNEVFDGNAALVEAGAPAAAAPLKASHTAAVAMAAAPSALDLELDFEEIALDDDEDDSGPAPEHAVVPEPQEQKLESDPADPPPDHAADAADVDDTDHRHEPRFDMPSEHIVAVALDDLHHFDEEPEPIVDAAAEAEAVGGGIDGHDADRAADDAAAADLLTAAPDSALLAAGAGTVAAHAVAPPGAGDRHEDAAADEDTHGDEPGFVKRAHERERFNRAARLAMIAGVPLLAFVLLGQGVYTLRNRLAADHPALAPTLQALCAPLGCTVGLPRQIDALAVEQGELQTLAPDTYSFATVLRNQSRVRQAWPHIELVLNDTADKPVLRRVFAPRDYLPRTKTAAGTAGATSAAEGFGPRSEQSVKLYFALDRVKASGYHIAIFYP